MTARAQTRAAVAEPFPLAMLPKEMMNSNVANFVGEQMSNGKRPQSHTVP